MRFKSFLIVLLVFVLTGCTNKLRPAGMFYQSFSVPDQVAKLAIPQLQPVTASNSGQNSPGEPTHHQQGFHAVYDIKEEPGKPFNEELLIAKLTTAIQNGISAAGYHERGGGRESEGIHFDYNGSDSNRHFGSIDVYFVRAENRQYKIFGTIREAVIDK